MQSFQEPQGAEEEASEEEEEEDEEDDITSTESDDSEEEEVPGAPRVQQSSKRGQLDWDNSTLTYWIKLYIHTDAHTYTDVYTHTRWGVNILTTIK